LISEEIGTRIVAAAAGAVTTRHIKACSVVASHAMLLAGFTVAVHLVYDRHLHHAASASPAYSAVSTPTSRRQVYADTTPWVIDDDALEADSRTTKGEQFQLHQRRRRTCKTQPQRV